MGRGVLIGRGEASNGARCLVPFWVTKPSHYSPCQINLAPACQLMTHVTTNSPIRNLAILADFLCIPTLNSHHSRDGVRGVGDNANEGIMHTMFTRIARFRIRELYADSRLMQISGCLP